jgi:fibronectin type 3 domain-containing protein
VVKPDIIPPTAPVLSTYDITENGIRIQWVNSSDEDVAVHKLYRRLIADTVKTWTLIQEFKRSAITEWIDKDCREGHTYSYTMVAVDSAKLESEPAKPFTITVPEKRVKDVVKNLEVEVDRKGRTVTITWEQGKTAKNIRRYELYRGQAKEPMSLYKQMATATNSFIDTDLRVNTRYKYAIRAVYMNGQYSDFVTKSVIY